MDWISVLLALSCGLIIGASLGVFLMALMFAGRDTGEWGEG